MRLFILADAAAPHTRRWAKWFAENGHEVHVITFNPNSMPNYFPAIVHCVWRYKSTSSTVIRAFKILLILWRIRSIFKKLSPDLVHAHSAGGYAWAAAIIRFKPYVVTPWGTDLLFDINNSKINYWLTSNSLVKANLVTTDGFHFFKILESLGVDKKRVYVRPFGTNVNHFKPSTDHSERCALGVPNDSPLIISTRTLNPVHDVETFIHSIPAVNKKYPNAHFIIVGDGVERAKFEELVRKTNLTSVTHFVGMVEEDRVCRLLQISDIYVSTSKMDAGLAASTAEAMAVGLPIIQTNNSDNEYWTPNGEGGILVPNSDSLALSKAIIDLLSDEDRCLKMGIRNRDKVLSEYNMDIEMSKIHEQYKLLIDTN